MNLPTLVVRFLALVTTMVTMVDYGNHCSNDRSNHDGYYDRYHDHYYDGYCDQPWLPS